jgi:hypothetical protein
VATAWLRVRWNVAADEGVLHDALGFATFFLAVGLIISTERLLRFYGDVITSPPPDAIPVVPAVSSSRGAASRRGWALVGGLSVVIGLLQIPAFAASVDRLYGEWRAEPLAEFGDRGLDEQIEEWKRIGYERVERDRNSPFGRHSQIWIYAQEERRAIVSLDYPFHGWHELTECYETQGWRVTSREIVPLGNDRFAVSVALRHDATRRDGRLIFAIVARDGGAYSVRTRGEVDEWADRLKRRLDELSGKAATAAPDADQITCQIQLFLESYTPLSASEDAAAQRLFVAAYDRLQRRLGNDAEKSPPGDLP